MVNNHWTCYGTEKSFVPNEDKFGFVYIITNTKNDKAYVGCKQYYIGKSKKQSKWQTYTGSSKYLNEDIKKIGKKYFTFEVIAEYKNKRSLRYYEMYYQVKWNVLTATVEGTDEPAFYNSYVGGKFYRPVESYKDPEYLKNLSKGMGGNPIKCTKKNGEIIIFNNATEAIEKGYDYSTIHKLAKGGRHNRKDRPNGKGFAIRTRHKDIVKVKYIDNEE